MGSRLLYRLRNDFRLSIITLLGACAIFGITPFAIWRFIRGDIIVGVVDLFIVAGVIGFVTYAWRTGDTWRTGVALVLIICSVGIAVATLIGEVGLFWLYPAFICTFFLTQTWVAVAANLSAIIFLGIHGVAFSSTEQMASFAVTGIVVSACASVFALRNEVQHQRLEQLATRDSLTGVKNRRSMDEEINKVMLGHARNHIPHGLAILDVDHFKMVNDTYGHTVGDNILIELARLIEANIRCSDQLFRYGGEEFVLLLPDTDRNNLEAMMQRMRKALHQSLKSPAGTITVSFGLAILLIDDDAAQWFSRADKALYRAKATGRDRIVIADDLTSQVNSTPS